MKRQTLLGLIGMLTVLMLVIAGCATTQPASLVASSGAVTPG
jgi:hypothetical protein